MPSHAKPQLICAIVLAAGRSRRMGTQKLLLPFGGKPVIAHIIEEILRSQISHIIVVASAQDPRIMETLAGHPVEMAANPDPEGDMLSSVRCGLRALPAECQAVLVVLGDQPSITAHLINAMIDAYRAANRDILVPVFNGRRGHPLLFSSRYREEILGQHDQTGLRGLLQAHANSIVELPVNSPAILADMDVPEDYQRELARLSSCPPPPKLMVDGVQPTELRRPAGLKTAPCVRRKY